MELKTGELAEFGINGAHGAEIMRGGILRCVYLQALCTELQYVSRTNRGSFLPSAVHHAWTTLTT